MPDPPISDNTSVTARKEATELKGLTPFNAAEIFEQAAPSVLQKTNYLLGFPLAGGTGFFVTSDQPHSCEVATVGHVANGNSAHFTTKDGKIYDATAELVDQTHEISIFRLQGVSDPKKTCIELPVNTVEPVAGQPVLAIGSSADTLLGFGGTPESRDLSAEHPGFMVGTILGTGKKTDALDTMKEHPFINFLAVAMHGSPNPQAVDTPMVKSTIIGTPGYSGGPWLDKNGAVIGMTDSSFDAFGESYELGEQMKFLQADLDRIRAQKSLDSAKADGQPEQLIMGRQDSW